MHTSERNIITSIRAEPPPPPPAAIERTLKAPDIKLVPTLANQQSRTQAPLPAVATKALSGGGRGEGHASMPRSYNISVYDPRAPTTTTVTNTSSTSTTSVMQYMPLQQHKDAPLNSTATTTTTESLVIKTVLKPLNSPLNHCDIQGCQVRPSVVETNPYVATKLVKQEFKLDERNLLAVDQLPPDTSIMPLPKPTTLMSASQVGATGCYNDLSAHPRADIGYNMACQQNVHLVGRKRHLHQYAAANAYNEPVIKQARFDEPPIKVEHERKRPADISVIAVNENAPLHVSELQKKPRQLDSMPSSMQRTSSIIVDTKDIILPVCKQEPLTPTMEVAPPIVTPPPIKTETHSLIAARIRTKAELKGFTFNPPPVQSSVDASPPAKLNTPTMAANSIKEEPKTQANHDFPSIPGLNEDFNQGSLLDFGWSNACTGFVQQLLGNSVKKAVKKSDTSTTTVTGNCVIKTEELSEDDLPVSTIVLKKDSVIVSTDKQRKLDEIMDFENSISNLESAETNMSFERNEAKSLTYDTVGTQSGTQKKSNKLDREKLRQQQEKRIAARLKVASSSETDNEMDKRKSDRQKKHLKKSNKARSTHSKLCEKHRFSDCGSDTSETEDNIPLKNSIQVLSEGQEAQKEADAAERPKITENSNKDRVLKPVEKLKSKPSTKAELKAKPEKGSQAPHATKSSTDDEDVDDDDDNDDDDDDDSEEEEQDEGKEKHRQRSGKVQYDKGLHSNKNVKTVKSTKSEKSEKSEKNTKLVNKVSLNTVTRSKRKRELELQLANSKVLRNEKIIRNSTTKSIKRKYVKKFVNSQNSLSKADAATSVTKGGREVGTLMATRLRSKNKKFVAKMKSALYTNNLRKTNKLADGKNKNAKPNQKESTVTSTSGSGGKRGKEPQTDLLMEVYRFKRALKVPPSLITIKHPSSNHKIATSLPDLERRDIDEMSIFSNNSSTGKRTPTFVKASSECVNARSETKTCEEPRSIIDLLHSRVINSGVQKSRVKVKSISKAQHNNNNNSSNNNNSNSVHSHSEASQNTESNSLSDLLPTPKKDDIDDESNDGGKKRHFSIFDTKVLQTKTRTESRMQQKREHIREIFVGDDRPASAPPEITSSMDGSEKMTYEQKYEQFLQQMNIISEEKLRRFGRATTSITMLTMSATVQLPSCGLKQEEDFESASAIDADEKIDCEQPEQDNMSIISNNTTTGFRRRRPAKYLRRKGSSGFDYLRKKKKSTNVTHTANSNGHTPSPHNATVRAEKHDENVEKKTKTEHDVCREIQKWVLNKGVGQSTMHKAARMGYIDVIVYCLDRMGMNPDQKDNAGYTPLHEACTNGWLDIARILLQYGANHSEAAHSGIRPLHEASENDYEEIVRLLLSYGADPLLATYSGQTPLMLATSTAVRNILNNHLSDVQSNGPNREPWRFNGPWEIFDPLESGYDIFGGAPNFTCDMSRALRKSSVSSAIANRKQNSNQYEENSSKTVVKTDKCAVMLDNIERFHSVRLFNDGQPEFIVANTDSEGDVFEFEEADVLLPPLYLLKDEGNDKWVLLNDLCNLLKVKSKDTLLNKIYPASSVSSAHKSLMRELKMSDFLEKATCLQLLCAGEKLNICASKVVLIKYNENVRNLLGVKTILMKF